MTIDHAESTRTDLLSSDAGALLMQCVAALVLAFFIVFMLTPFGAAVSPDSIFYLDIAAHIHSGAGVKSTDYALAHAGQNLAISNTAWPPLYPTLLAVSSGVPSALSAAMLSVVLLATTLLIQQRILQRFLSWPIATLAGLPLALTVPMLTIHTFAWSEQLFMTLMTILFFVSQTYLLDEQRRMHSDRLLVAAVAVVLILIFYTRYIGIVFFPLLPLLYLMSGRPRNLLPTFLIAGFACGLAAVALMAYNFEMSGSVTGATRSSTESSIAEQLVNVVQALYPTVVYMQKPMLVAVLSLFVAAALLYAAFARKRVETDKSNVLSITAWLAFGSVLYYIVCIVVLRSLVSFDNIEMRLVGVMLPYIWIGCMALLAAVNLRVPRLLPAGVAAMLVVSLVITGYFTLLDTRQSWRETGSPGLRMNTGGFYNNFNQPLLANPYRNFLAPITGPDSVLVVASRPHVTRYRSGLVSYEMPKQPTDAEIEKLFGLPGRSYLVVSPDEGPVLEAIFVQHGAEPVEVTMSGDTALIHLPLIRKSTTN